MSPQHLQKYICEYVGRNNHRKSNIIDQITDLVLGMNNKRLTFKELTN